MGSTCPYRPSRATGCLNAGEGGYCQQCGACRFCRYRTYGENMSTPNPVISDAEPVAIAVLKALQVFIANLGTDPLQVAVKFPGAAQVFLGTVEMQLPAL